MEAYSDGDKYEMILRVVILQIYVNKLTRLSVLQAIDWENRRNDISLEKVDNQGAKPRLQVQLLVEIRQFATFVHQQPIIRKQMIHFSDICEQYFGGYSV